MWSLVWSVYNDWRIGALWGVGLVVVWFGGPTPVEDMNWIITTLQTVNMMLPILVWVFLIYSALATQNNPLWRSLPLSSLTVAGARVIALIIVPSVSAHIFANMRAQQGSDDIWGFDMHVMIALFFAVFALFTTSSKAQQIIVMLGFAVGLQLPILANMVQSFTPHYVVGNSFTRLLFSPTTGWVILAWCGAIVLHYLARARRQFD